jgi:hypothetical protein
MAVRERRLFGQSLIRSGGLDDRDAAMSTADTGVQPLPRVLGEKALGFRARGASQKAQWTAGNMRENPIGDESRG